MKEFKGTKGSWQVQGTKFGNPEIVGSEFQTIAEVEYISKEGKADAQLIAAAPELLEALQECMLELYSIHSKYGDKQNARDHSPALEKSEQAINKTLKVFVNDELR